MIEVFRWGSFAVLNVLIFHSWFLLPGRRSYSVADRILLAATASVAQVILSTLFIGVALDRGLTAPNLAALNIIIAAGLVLLGKRIGRSQSAPWLELVEAFGRLRSAATAAAVKWILALAAGSLMVLIFFAVIYPPIEWDSLMYHLPSAAYYMQQQSLDDPLLPMDSYSRFGIDGSVWINAFPKNIELLFLWAILLPGSDVLVDLVQMVFALLGAVAAYSLARRLGAARQWSTAAAGLWLLTPIVLAQSRSNLIDLSNSALILTAVALLYRAGGNNRVKTIVAGLAVGVVLGAKWSGILFAAALWVFLVIRAGFLDMDTGRPRRLLFRLRATALESAAFLAPVVLAGGYWYAKNWYLYHNPLWPFSLSVFGQTILNGYVKQANILALTFPRELIGTGHIEQLLMSWREPVALMYDADVRLGGLGPVWFVIGLPALAYLARGSVAKKDWHMVLLLVVVGAMVWLHPEDWWTRYTMFIAAIGAAAFAKVRTAMNRPETTRLLDMMLVVLAVYGAAATLASSHYLPSKVAELAATPPQLRTSGQVRPEIVSSAYDYISLQTAERPANVAFGSGLNFTYPLWGTRLRNRVQYFWAPYRKDRAASWPEQLRAAKIKYLLVSAASPEYRSLKRQDTYKRVFWDRKEGYVVYKAPVKP